MAVQGRIAENLRRTDGYRQWRQVFIDPSLLLRQARVNALLDGKELIMPAAGLKEGFFLLKPFTIPFRDLLKAVTYKGLADYGVHLRSEEISLLDISLLAGESFAVDRQGARLGDGAGFFDLAAALLGAMGGLGQDCRVAAAIYDQKRIIGSVPLQPWDLRCSDILGPDGFEALSAPARVAGIFWDELPEERIRRISPLWKLHQSEV